MDRQEIFEHVKQQYGTEPDYPWKDWNAVLRHKDNNKWYGVVLKVGRDKLGLSGDEAVDVLNVKCDPVLIGSLRTQPGFHPAYHMNKEKWISVRLDGSAPGDEIKSLIAMSYELTGTKKKKRGNNIMTADELLFFDKMKSMLPVYLELKERLMELHPDVFIKVSKTQISFKNKYIFAMVSFQRVPKCPKEYLLVSFGLSYEKQSPRIAAATEACRRRWTHHVVIRKPEEIDEELMGWIEEACQFSNSK